VAYLRKGETYTDLAAGFGIDTTTVPRVSQFCVALPGLRVVATRPDVQVRDLGA
jgi:hypothetical protein